MIYLDNAATTRICAKSLEAINKFYDINYFNPSAVYKGAIEVKNAIEIAREQVAKLLYVDRENIFFTSGGTEGDNLAILGTCQNKAIGKILCSSCEHPAVYNTVTNLKDKGFDVDYIPCKSNGTVDIDAFEKLISTEKVGFVSIMHVNNETGGINDIVKLSKLLHEKHPQAIFHSDGVQAYGKVLVNLKNSDVDLYSFSAHKINGAKGVGGIYVKNKNKLKPIHFGGQQEKGMRSGTENTAGIVAFGEAAVFWKENGKTLIKNFFDFRNIVIEKLKELDGITYNTQFDISSPHILSLNIDGIKGEVLLHMLEAEEIYIGRGSACSTKETAPRA
ncbi:MAG: cysteine desulfurase family protein, partial [Clostridia bacterium]